MINKVLIGAVIIAILVILYSSFKIDELQTTVSEYETRRVNREAIIQLYELEIAESERINDSLYNLSKIHESFTDSVVTKIKDLTTVTVTDEKIEEALRWIESQQ